MNYVCLFVCLFDHFFLCFIVCLFVRLFVCLDNRCLYDVVDGVCLFSLYLCCHVLGGGWHHKPSDVSSAGIVIIVILMLSIVLCIIAATYCYVRRPSLLQRLRGRGYGSSGVRASDYVGQCDASAQMPSPPPYDGVAASALFPPPYSPTDTGAGDKPPDYEVVLLRNGQCLYRRQHQSSVSESDANDDILPQAGV